jgi:hypothetical protein
LIGGKASLDGIRIPYLLQSAGFSNEKGGLSARLCDLSVALPDQVRAAARRRS